MIQAPPAPTESLRVFKGHKPGVIINMRPSVKSFYHSGDLGDIIYALPFVKSVGGGVLYIGPDSEWPTNAKLDHSRYHFLLPLLQVQPYLKRALYAGKCASFVNYDLNKFRELWFGNGGKPSKGITRLFEAYSVRFNLPQVREDEAWLTVPAPVSIPGYPVVIHRSFRYRNARFPWAEVARRYAYRMLFVGLKEEFDEWTRYYGEVAQFYPVKNALELASVIAGAKLFIGNQSLPNALALGLNVPIIQEAVMDLPDCKLNRPNAQYYGFQQVVWPDFGRRYVTTNPADYGLYELGPCADAHGIGDSLTLTPLIQKLSGKVLLKLPPSMSEIAALFTNLCPVLFTNDYPEFRHRPDLGHMTEAKLRLFKQWPADILPAIAITPEESTWAMQELKDYRNPFVFVPTCSRQWTHIRQKPPEFWQPYVNRLSKRFNVLQFGFPDYPLLENANRMSGYNVRQIAALYSKIGRYVGVDTGDVHLMLAVGGSVIVYRPDPQPGYNPAEYDYPNCSRAQFRNFRELENDINPSLQPS